jgi:hypothetical protein
VSLRNKIVYKTGARDSFKTTIHEARKNPILWRIEDRHPELEVFDVLSEVDINYF